MKYLGKIEHKKDLITKEYADRLAYTVVTKTASDVASEYKLDDHIALEITDAVDKVYLSLIKPSDFDIERGYRLRFTTSSSWTGPLSIVSAESDIVVTYDPECPTIKAGYSYEFRIVYYNEKNIVCYGKEFALATKTVVLNENTEA